jgi:Ricin-type beta-trefoil lectin domain
MINTARQAIAAAATLMLTMGGTLTLGIATATPAHADTSCPNEVYLGIIRSDINNYLDTYGHRGEDNPTQYVKTYNFTGGSNQLWCVERNSGTRTGLFIHPVTPSGTCLDAHQNSDFYPVWVWGCNGTDAQKWCWNGAGYITRWNDGQLALKDNGRYHVVSLSQGTASRWYTDGAAMQDNC